MTRRKMQEKINEVIRRATTEIEEITKKFDEEEVSIEGEIEELCAPLKQYLKNLASYDFHIGVKVDAEKIFVRECGEDWRKI